MRMILNRIKNWLRANYNRELQEKGLIHERTKAPIREEFVIATSKGLEPKGDVEVTYIDGFQKTFNRKTWKLHGSAILKNAVLVKLVEHV